MTEPREIALASVTKAAGTTDGRVGLVGALMDGEEVYISMSEAEATHAVNALLQGIDVSNTRRLWQCNGARLALPLIEPASF